MQSFTTLTAIAAPLPIANIDTDKIIPARFLKTIQRTGLGVHLFDTLRYQSDGTERADFVLNTEPYRHAQILVAGENFGCGSSREHAPWALLDFGIRCVIAPSFADIFYNNCFKNGILPVRLPQAVCDLLAEDAALGGNARLTIDLQRQVVIRPSGETIAFDIDDFRRHSMLHGLDDIGQTLQHAPRIDDFERRERAARDWLPAIVPVEYKGLSGEHMAANKKLLLLPGDGIGPEVMREARRVIDWLERRRAVGFEIEEDLVGGASIDARGTPITDEVIAQARAVDAVLFGAVGGPKWDGLGFDMRPEVAILTLRRELGLFANLRPAVVMEPLVDASALKPEIVRGLDIMIVRESTGGIYFGEPRGITTLPDGQRQGINTEVYTTHEIERVARVAFDLARRRKGRVCSVEKANVMESGLLWRETVAALHQRDYGDVELSNMYADNCAMQLVRNPRQFDVIVTTNLFGDLLSDLASMLTGSLGMLPSATLGAPDESGRRNALYEPIHGSAPDIAGRGIANPLAQILSFAMLLRYSFEMEEDAVLIETACTNVLAGGLRTADIMGSATAKVGTAVMGECVLRELEKLAA